MDFKKLDESARQDLAGNLALFRQAFIDEKSLYTRTNRRIRSEMPPLRSEAVQTGTAAADLRTFLRSTGNRYSHERVLQHMRTCFGSRKVLPVE